MSAVDYMMAGALWERIADDVQARGGEEGRVAALRRMAARAYDKAAKLREKAA